MRNDLDYGDETAQAVDRTTARTLTEGCREQFGKLMALIGQLEDRLEPVLLSDELRSQTEMDSQPARPMAPLVLTLSNHAAEIGAAQQKISRLLQRIQA